MNFKLNEKKLIKQLNEEAEEEMKLIEEFINTNKENVQLNKHLIEFKKLETKSGKEFKNN